MKKILLLLCLLAILSSCNLPTSDREDPTSTSTKDLGGEEQVDEEAPTSTASKTHTPTQSAADQFATQIQVSAFNLFNAGEDPLDVSLRHYANDYSQSEARVVYCEFEFSHPGPEENLEYVMRAVYYDSVGEVYGEVEIEPLIEVGWTSSHWLIGFGWDDPGKWDVGEYRVDIYLGDTKIASDQFIIMRDTPTPEITSTPRSTSTPTPKPGAVVETDSLNIRKGPGTNYAIVTGVPKGDTLDILGQAYSCSWLKIRTSNGVEGWVSSELVRYELACSDIPAVAVPPTPIPLPTLTPTSQAPAGKTVSVRIKNDTGGNISISLSGPASYSFSFTPGNHTIQVLPGTYSYTAWGCGSSLSGTKKLSKGDEWRFYCN